jgi:hypothetical protein
MESGKLNDQQRHELWGDVHNAMEQQMEKRMDTYFAAAPAQRTAILDQQIDEMQARMKEWQQRRTQDGQTPRDPNSRRLGDRTRRPEAPGTSGRPAAAPGGSPPPANAGGGPGGGPGGGGFRGDRHGPPSREQRKDHFESRDPDSRARRMAYTSAMQARAQQRGIQMPMMGRGGRDH